MFSIEIKKLKGTFLFGTFIMGGLFSAAIIIANLYYRHEGLFLRYGKSISAVVVPNWNTVALVNIMMIIIGSAILYHVEYENNAILKMNTLPINTRKLFYSKFLILMLMFIVVSLIEFLAFYICIKAYLPKVLWLEKLGRLYLYSYILIMPAASFMVLISSIFKNMWTTVGIGVMGIMISIVTVSFNNSFLEYLPFSIMNQPGNRGGSFFDLNFLIGALCETFLIFIISEIIFRKRREVL